MSEKEKNKKGIFVSDEEIKAIEPELKDKNYKMDVRVFNCEEILGEKFFELHGKTFDRLKNGYMIKQKVPEKTEDNKIEIVEKEFPMPGLDMLMSLYSGYAEKMIETQKKIKRAKKKKNKEKHGDVLFHLDKNMQMIRERIIRTMFLYRESIKKYSNVEYKDDILKNLLVYIFKL